MTNLLKLISFCFVFYLNEASAIEKSEEKEPIVEQQFRSAHEYAQAMKEQGKESVLIVGCGHSTTPGLEGDHTHESCWSVDVANPEIYRDTSKGAPPQNPQWKEIQADEEMDITNPLAVKKYKNLFDVIVLERPWATTLNNPYTLFNAALMLKPGGMLIIDVHSSYHYQLYEGENSIGNSVLPESYFPSTVGLISSSNESFATIKQMKADFQEAFEAEKTKDILLKRFNMDLTNENKKISLAPQLFEMGKYLTTWGFESIMNLKNVNQPYTGGHGIPARSGDLLVAVKSKETESLIPEWKSAIDRYIAAQKRRK